MEDVLLDVRLWSGQMRDETPEVARRSYPEAVLAGPGLRLRLAHDSDAPTISGWTAAPEVHDYWGPGRRLTLAEVQAKYTGRRAPAVISYVVRDGDDAVGYLQAWQHDGRFGLDMFVAAAAQGHGVGPRAARALAGELVARGWEPLTVDPAHRQPSCDPSVAGRWVRTDRGARHR